MATPLNPSKLLDGRYVAKGTECPFKSECAIAQENMCHHEGTKSIAHFSCGAARAFDMIQRYKTSDTNGESQ